METIDGFELKELIEKKGRVENRIIKLDSILDIRYSDSNIIGFINCHFFGSSIQFVFFKSKNDEASRIVFTDCTFNNDSLEFICCEKRDSVCFMGETNIKNYLSFDGCNLYLLYFEKKCKIETLNIHRSEIIKKFTINKNSIKKLSINNTDFKGKVEILDSTFNSASISNLTCSNVFNFNKNEIKNNLDITNVTFQKFNFYENKFSEEEENCQMKFLDNTFKGKSYLSNWKALNTDLIIQNCDFKKSTRFNNSSFKSLKLEETTFNDICSFQDTEFYNVIIDRTSFDKTAYFDDILISDIENCDRKTLRNIKHELQRSNNKIDLDKFKASEINAYRKELKKDKKYCYNNIDVFILDVGYWFSKNGTNWFRALLVSLLGSFIFYALFFWISVGDFGFGNFDFSELCFFMNGFTKFLIPTNIYNPLIDKTFVIGWSWLPFILGKIFLSIGIYEIIVSFRKFKS
ncbi:hypothetical protein [Tenacibaculum finnmarkense]|uniref:hypothetical protein n=1 Tax=Tenacibaculum finnmarkense TaxID=2781243 RepID=UPI001E4BDD36|nr:hypothetical protein [Tenacibaculum finnmarkense]MCD8403559.1 hypothetical protein [Tenacibaculum finnmarkense genomovar finnmarkense]WCC48115.1 hypothetical protein PJH08_05275 [Tenacibaculum finnmarkense]